jgi:hypothetical protein
MRPTINCASQKFDVVYNTFFFIFMLISWVFSGAGGTKVLQEQAKGFGGAPKKGKAVQRYRQLFEAIQCLLHEQTAKI